MKVYTWISGKSALEMVKQNVFCSFNIIFTELKGKNKEEKNF